MKFIHLPTVDSTNRYCELLDLDQVEEFTVVYATEQTAGKGQQGHHWASDPGENVTFSLIFHPTFLPVSDQYLLTKVLSLGLVDYLLTEHFIDVRIKWPNDIYVGKDKICGMLVANRLRGPLYHSAICGIGLNVNQESFPDWIFNPISMRQITGIRYDTEKVLHNLCSSIENRYHQLTSGHIDILDRDYLDHLMNLNTPTTYRYQGKIITATITGVNRYGHLQLTTENGERLSCQMGEINLIL